MADWERAFGELLAVRGTALRAYAYLLTGEPAAAADLVQDALLRVFSRLRVSDDIAQLEGYVRRAMLNQYVDGRRRAGWWSAPASNGGSESAVAATGGVTSIAFPATPFTCGVAFPAASSVGGRTVTLTQQSIARSSTGWAGTVRSRYFNPGKLPYPLIAGLPPRNLAVVADGKMVGRAAVTTTAKPVELKAGAANTLTARIDIRSCAGDPLPAGSYLLYEDNVPSPGPVKPTHGKPVVDTTPLGRIDLR